MGILDLSWFEVDELIDNMILDIVEKDYTIEQVCGVARGGLIPGVIISQRLGVPFVPLEWQTRDGKRRDEIKLIQTFNVLLLHADVITFFLLYDEKTT